MTSWTHYSFLELKKCAYVTVKPKLDCSKASDSYSQEQNREKESFCHLCGTFNGSTTHSISIRVDAFRAYFSWPRSSSPANCAYAADARIIHKISFTVPTILRLLKKTSCSASIFSWLIPNFTVLQILRGHILYWKEAHVRHSVFCAHALKSRANVIKIIDIFGFGFWAYTILYT